MADLAGQRAGETDPQPEHSGTRPQRSGEPRAECIGRTDPTTDTARKVSLRCMASLKILILTAQ